MRWTRRHFLDSSLAAGLAVAGLALWLRRPARRLALAGASSAALAPRAYTVTTATVAMRDGATIDARVYWPASGAPWAGVVYAHGGVFRSGDCASHRAVSERLAGLGLAVVDSSFRQGAAAPHPGALRDLADVAAFARAAWGARVPLGVAGSSSGGYYARSPRRRGRRG